MSAVPTAPASPSGHDRGPRPSVVAAANIRGSSAMLLGQVLTLLVSFAVQVIVVRHLTKEDYGAFAWALSTVLLVQAVLPLGLDRASARFLASYDEQRDYPRLFGFIAVEVIVVGGLGVLVVLATLGLSGPLSAIAPSPQAIVLLGTLIVLAPVQALDILVVEMFAVFASPWSVFLRRYVVEPSLRLLVVVLLVTTGEDSSFLAAGYVAAGALGMVLYLLLLGPLFKRTGLAAHFSPRRLRLPWREVAAFCGPMLLTSLVAVATTEFVAVVLGRTSGATEVAAFRAVQPFAALNLVVMFSFTTLFTPAVSRLVARRARPEVRDLYWQTAAWITVLTFPVLAMTTVFARPFIEFTLGDRYASSAPVLVVLAVGYYVNAALGFNGLTVQILGRLRWVLLTNITTVVAMVVATLVLVRRFDALGGAIAVLVTLVVHNLLKQAGLGFGAGVGLWQAGHARVLLHVVAGIVALSLLASVVNVPIWIACVVVSILWLVLIRRTRHVIRVAQTFPELGRLPVLRWILR
jgi:O-antigen/teichoic acid export membrane protein